MQVKDGYLRQLSGLLRMSKKSGQVILGFDQVFGAAGSKAVGWRIEACDGAADGRGKIRARARAMCYEMALPLPGVIACYSAAELGELFGRGRLSKRLTAIADKLSGFTALIPQDWPDIAHELREEQRYDSEQE